MDNNSKNKNDDLTADVLFTINLLKTRPKTLIGENEITYNRLSLFLEGYLHGLNEALKNNLIANIMHWFQKRVGQTTPLFITHHILHRHTEKNEEDLKLILLQALEEFFKENPDWQKNYRS